MGCKKIVCPETSSTLNKSNGRTKETGITHKPNRDSGVRLFTHWSDAYYGMPTTAHRRRQGRGLTVLAYFEQACVLMCDDKNCHIFQFTSPLPPTPTHPSPPQFVCHHACLYPYTTCPLKTPNVRSTTMRRDEWPMLNIARADDVNFVL